MASRPQGAPVNISITPVLGYGLTHSDCPTAMVPMPVAFPRCSRLLCLAAVR